VSGARAARESLERIFRAGVAAADPAAALRSRLAIRADSALEVDGEVLPAGSPVALLALGKAAIGMAGALEDLAGDRLTTGLVIAPAGGEPVRLRSRALAAAHPIPDASSEGAGRAALDFVAKLSPGGSLLVLLSGGTSSLLTCPAPGLPLAALAETTRILLEAGAPIDELNAVRKHLTAVFGGRLAAATRAQRVIVLVVSDVLGDRLDVIGSGPFAADPSTYGDARSILEGRGVWREVPVEVRAHVEAGVAGSLPETPDESDPRVRHVVIANNRTALEGAMSAARSEGLRPLLVSDRMAGEARVAGRRLARVALASRSSSETCLLAGGETTVTVRGAGRGGRSQELALAAALELRGTSGVAALAAGTDGRDGPTDAAGAYADGGSVAAATSVHVDAEVCLRENDAHRFFEASGGLVRTGPTGTNVMDLALLRVGRR